MVDTRDGTGSMGTTPLGAGEIRTLSVYNKAGLPASGIGAVVVDVAVANATAATYVTMWAGGATRPATSNINAAPGLPVSNTAIIPVSSSGQIQIRNHAGSADVVVDVQGYFTPAGTASNTTGGFVSVSQRALDTQTGVGQGSTIAKLAAHSYVDVPVAGVGDVPLSASSIVINATVSTPTDAGLLTTYPTGTTRPTAPTLDFALTSVANVSIVKPGTSGMIRVYSSSDDPVDVFLDVQGYFASTGTGGGFTSSQARVLDTRTTQAIPAGGTAAVTVGGLAGVPTDASVSAVAVNLTVVSPTSAGSLRAWATGDTEPMGVSITDYPTAVTTANLVSIPLGTGGAFTVRNTSTTSVTLLVDLQGWFASSGLLAPTISSTKYLQESVSALGGAGSFTISSTADAVTVYTKLDDSAPYASTTLTTGADGHSSSATVSITPAVGWHTLSAYVSDGPNTSAVATYEFGLNTSSDSKPDGANDGGSVPTATPATSSPTPTGDPAATVTASGRVVQPNGSAASGYPVVLYFEQYVNGAPDDAVVVGTATTTSTGDWSTSIGTLPSAVQAEVASNDGVLNLLAVTSGSSSFDGRPLQAVAAVQAGMVVSGAVSAAAAVARTATVTTAPLLPLQTEANMTAAPDDATVRTAFGSRQSAALVADPDETGSPNYYQFVAADSTNLTTTNAMIADSVNYASYGATPTSGDYNTVVASASGDDPRCITEGGVYVALAKRSYTYTTVVAGHSYWDSYASVSYEQKEDSDSTIGISYNHGSSWSAGREFHLGHSMSFESGYSHRGPKYSKEWGVPVQWDQNNHFKCKIVHSHLVGVYMFTDAIPIRVKISPSGGSTGAVKRDVLIKDGYTQWSKATCGGCHAQVPGGSYFQLTKGRTRGFSYSASISGFSATTSTNRSTDRKQRIDAGTQNINVHDIFAFTPLSSSPNEFYAW